MSETLFHAIGGGVLSNWASCAPSVLRESRVLARRTFPAADGADSVLEFAAFAREARGAAFIVLELAEMTTVALRSAIERGEPARAAVRAGTRGNFRGLPLRAFDAFSGAFEAELTSLAIVAHLVRNLVLVLASWAVVAGSASFPGRISAGGARVAGGTRRAVVLAPLAAGTAVAADDRELSGSAGLAFAGTERIGVSSTLALLASFSYF